MTPNAPARPWLIATLCLLTFGGAGCPTITRIGGAQPLDEVLDELRAENEDLRDEIRDLERDRENLQAQIRTLEQRIDRRAELPEVSPGDIPAAARIDFGRYSGGFDTTGDGRDDTLRMYVRTLDQAGRFIPIAGKAELQAVALSPGRDPVTVIERTWAPAEFARTYRAGMTGTHYTLEVEMPERLPGDEPELTVKINLIDGATGAALRRQKVVEPRGYPAPQEDDESPDNNG